MAAKPLLTNVQICRGLAALLVVVGHSLHDFDSIAARAALPPISSGINWGCGIDIFFVISGFIMVYVAGQGFGVPGAPRQFITKRLLRIVPLYWILTTALIIGSVLVPSLLNVPIGSAWHVIASYLFIPDPRPGLAIVRPVMALGWTLNYEMLFYAVFAATMALPFHRGVAALTGVLVAGITLRHVFDIQQTQIAFWLNPIILEFLFGVYIGVAHRAGWRLSAPMALGLGTLGLVLVTAANPLFATPDNGLTVLRSGLPAALLVAAAALGPALPTHAITRGGVMIGDASYALYLVHPFIIRPLREIWFKLFGGALPPSAYCGTTVLGAIIVTLLLHRYLEQPIGRMLAPLGRGPRPEDARRTITKTLDRVPA